MQRTQIYLASDQATWLDERARADGTTRSALIRDAIERYLDGGPAMLDWAIFARRWRGRPTFATSRCSSGWRPPTRAERPLR
ncbi:MAG: CopG family transcriptional regulator [Acidimicrobiales bacterium]